MYARYTGRNRHPELLLLLPGIALLLITIVLPSISALLLSFQKYTLGSQPAFIGLENYSWVLADPSFWNAVGRTILFTAVMVGGEITLGLAFALLMAKGFPLQRLWVSLLIAPLAVSEVVAIIVWKYMFAPNFGVINYVIASLGMVPPEWFVSKVHAFIAICVIDIWLNTPFLFTILYPAIISIAPELFEAARIDGASGVRVFTRITLPLIKPILLTVSTFRVIFVLRLFTPIWLFAGGGPGEATKVLSIYLFEHGFSYYQFGRGSAVAWILLIITMLVASPQIRAMYRTMFLGGDA